MEEQKYLSRVCPVCSSDKKEPNSISSEKVAESMTYEELVPYWNGFFKDKIYFTYSRCSNCGLLYTPTFFNQYQLEKLYSQMPPNMDEVPMEALRKTQYGYFIELKKNSSLDGSYIEVGPDIGLFTENCVKEGKYNEYWLFEPNVDVKGTLAEVIGDKKHHIIHEMFGFSHIPDNSASAAVMIHVLDHLLDPIETLKELRKKLKPGAKLLIVTHDESSLLRKIVGWRWPAFCLQHPQIYNMNSIKKLLNKAGFEVTKQKKTKNYFQLDFLFKHLLWAFGIKVKSFPSFCRKTLGLKLGNILTIATPFEGNE